MAGTPPCYHQHCLSSKFSKYFPLHIHAIWYHILKMKISLFQKLSKTLQNKFKLCLKSREDNKCGEQRYTGREKGNVFLFCPRTWVQFLKSSGITQRCSDARLCSVTSASETKPQRGRMKTVLKQSVKRTEGFAVRKQFVCRHKRAVCLRKSATFITSSRGTMAK